MIITSSVISEDDAAPCHEAMAITDACLLYPKPVIIHQMTTSFPNNFYVRWRCLDGIPPHIEVVLFDPMGNDVQKIMTREVNKNFIFLVGDETYMYVVKALDVSML